MEDIPSVPSEVRSSHRFLRLGVLLTEAGVTLVIWAAVAAAAGLADGVTLVGTIVVPFLVVVGCEATLGGTPIRLLAGLRVVDAATGDRLAPGASAIRQLGRLGTLAALGTVVGAVTVKTYDDRQRRLSGAAVVGRPDPLRSGAVWAVAALSALGAWALLSSGGEHGAWHLAAMLAAGAGVAGAVLLLPAIIGLASLGPAVGDEVSLVGFDGPAASVGGDLSLGLTGMRTGDSLDSTPVPRVALDGTSTEVIPSRGAIVTRKRRTAAEVEAAEPD